ncbi:MAG: hypothetical protein JWM32_813 [Verrucomicrobia bacterium]|nr:hypothetical protein [Verrucomicrobiota bacterium]
MARTASERLGFRVDAGIFGGTLTGVRRSLRRLSSIGLLALACAALLRATDNSPLARPPGENVYRLKFGDDPRWAQRDWDDRDWHTQAWPSTGGLFSTYTNQVGLPGHRGVYWVRFTVSQSGRRLGRPVITPWVWPADEDDNPINSVFLAAVFAYEFYWDGRLIGRSGVVGTDRASEVPGPLDNLMRIPDELLGPGPHVVAVRMSSYHFNFPSATFNLGLFFDNYAGRLVYETRQPIFPMIFAGCAVLVAVICGILFGFIERRRTLCLSGALSLAIAIFYTVIAWRWLHNDSYEWLYRRYFAIAGLAAVISGLIPWLLLELFTVPRRRWWWAALLVLLGGLWSASPLYHLKVQWLLCGTLVFSIGIAGWAVWRRRTGAWLALAGLVVGLVSARPAADSRLVLAPSFFLFFGLLVLALFGTLGLQMSAERRRARQGALAKARLETELLKKNIQPHFLMNTLTTIMEVIEQEPKAAVTMIEALSGEFRILARVAGETLIPLGQEIELCRAHLRIMSLRRGVEYSLRVHGANTESWVPPALFHTLVEGGVTHQLPRQGELVFTLDAEYRAGAVTYTLIAHGENPPARELIRDGTGLRYVKARLEESFAGRWSLTAGPVPDGWQTRIELGNAPGLPG